MIRRIIFALVLTILFSFTLLASCSDNAEADDDLRNMIGQMLMVGFRGFEVTETDRIVEDLTRRNLGGVILFDYDVPSSTPERNIESPEQVAQLVADLKSYSQTPLLVAIDQEGGRVSRLKTRFGFPENVSHEYLGELNNEDSTRHYAAITAETLNSLGININFAPVVDVNTNPENPVIGQLERSFSGDPAEVTQHARWFIDEHVSHGVFPTAKHFPGHGSAWNDSHFGMADVTETWDDLELDPYRDLIAEGRLELIMSAHIFNENWDEEHPATLTPLVMTEMLRNELGFEGVLVSDDMQMGAITEFYGLEQAIELSIKAGIDLLIFANNSVYEPDITERAIEIIHDLVISGEIPEERIRESYERITRLKGKVLD